MWFKQFLSSGLLAGLLLLASVSANAQTTVNEQITDAVSDPVIVMEPNPAAEVSKAASPAPARANIANVGSVAAFVDGIVEGYMASDKLAGVSLAIVYDNEILYSNGYGAAQLDEYKPVSAETTLFRLGSISKTFTWTAIMQLVENGKLGIDDPINQYLPPSLQLSDDSFETTILIRHLMSHNLGLEDSALGHLFVADEKNITSIRQYLSSHRPEQVREAGISTSYSNYGTALAGVIVEEVSGQNFNAYIEEHIFTPLNMRHSSFREPYSARTGIPEPIDPELAELYSAPFANKGGVLREQEFEFIEHIAPAGALSSTAVDMSRYMMAHLNLGVLKDSRILGEETARTMQQQLFSNSPQINGFAHGFMEFSLPNNFRAVGHGGATLYFMSNMVLVPELKLGIFITTNTDKGRQLTANFPALFVERFFTDSEETNRPLPPADFMERGQRYVGDYYYDRHSYSQLEKFTSILSSFTKVGISEDGYLITTSPAGNSSSWVEVSPLNFKELDGYRKLAFGEDEDGDISKMYVDNGTAASTKIGFLNGGGWLQMIALLTLIASFGSMVGAWLRRKRPINESLNESVASRLAVFMGFIWLVFFGFFMVALNEMGAKQELNVYSFPPRPMVVALWLAIGGVIITLINLPSFFVIWRDANWPLWRRIRHSSVIIISVLFVLTLYHWNILGFNYF